MIRIGLCEDQPISTSSDISGTALSVFFIFFFLGIGSFMKEINKKLKIPFSPMLFVLGLFFGFYWDSLGLIGQSCKKISEIEPIGVLLIFLPTLIYESGYNFDWHLFKRLFAQTAILAFPCVIILSTLLQLSVKVLLNYGDDYFTWESAFMFGAMLSCTDTVAVLAVLKESGAQKRFQSLIEGESLLNDGACVMLFQISYGIVRGRSASAFDVGSLFFTLCVGGTLIGLVFGMACVYWIKKIANDEILVLNITIVSAFLVYFISENVDFGVHISGVLGLVSLSLFMAAFGRSRISHEADHALREFWEYVVFASEVIIFILGGIIAGIRVFKDESEITQLDFYKMIALWLCLMVCRFISIAVFYPWLKKLGYGLTWSQILVLTYGGLRGSIGIAFALIVAKDESLPTKWRDIILFHMSGIAVCTLVVNGTTLSLLIKLLGLSTQSDIREKIYSNFLTKLNEEIEQECKKNNELKYLKEADVEYVKTLSGYKVYQSDCNQIIDKLAKHEKAQKEIQMKSIHQPLMDDEEDQELDQNLLTEIRRIFLMALKGIYMEQFESNQCSPDTIILLTESANLDLDNDKEHMNSWEFLQSQFSERYINLLFYMKDKFLIGILARNQLFSYIYTIYDAVSAYIEAIQILKEEASHYHFSQNLLLVILNEVEDNKKSAISYLEGYLEVSFPEISRELHTKKAAFEILEFEKQVLRNNLQSGQLNDKEFLRMKRNIDKKVKNLNELNPPWQMPSLIDILTQHELFKSLTQANIQKLLEGSREDSFGRDQLIFKEGDRANEICIITRGAGNEFSDRSKIREKRTLNEATPIYMLVAPSIRYQTSLVADCVINATFIKIQTLQMIMKQIPEFEEAIWRNSIPLLCRVYSDQFKPLCNLKINQIAEIVSKSVFQKIKKNQLIRFEQGGILLKGTLCEGKESIQEASSEDEDVLKNSEENQDSTQKDALCLIGPTSSPLRARTGIIVLLFKSYQLLEQYNQLNQNISEGAKNSNRRSGKSDLQKRSLTMIH
ncbi:unnamed protein product [Paramecium primaurelia]|uniref:Cyclic nucleotide-binding domain-containing protein n=1 Tax=Paramecium primaurelia TaxID=5886 RepID=A0A8S1L660_PARPR|nr:unnamed protein product [Paramecium primaurelia]